MKKIYLPLIFLFLFSSFSYGKTVDLKKYMGKSQIININFEEDVTYKIYSKPLFNTMITFGDEKVQEIELSDEYRWSKVDGGNYVIVKPSEENISTDLRVITDQNIYYFILMSTGESHLATVKFNYPDKERELRRLLAESEQPVHLIDIAKMNNFYTMTEATAWTPVMIFDADGKTYFVMSQKLQEMPSFLIKNDDNTLGVVSFRIIETENGVKIMMFDRVFKKGVLGLGKKQVVITNHKFLK